MLLFQKRFFVEHIYEYLIGGRKMGRKKSAETFGEVEKGSTIYVYTFDGSWSNLNESEGVITKINLLHNDAKQFESELSDGIIDSPTPKKFDFSMYEHMLKKDIYVMSQYLRWYKYIVVSLCKLNVDNAIENKRKYGGIS